MSTLFSNHPGGNRPGSETLIVQESLIRFLYRQETLYWEMRYRPGDDTTQAGYVLSLRMPLEGSDITQSFTIDPDGIMKLIEWLAQCQGFHLKK